MNQKTSKNLKICCPQCESHKIVRNGSTAGGQQNHKCRDCGRQFVLHPRNRQIDGKVKIIIRRLLTEGIPVSVIARVTEISARWIYELKKRGTQNDR